MSPFGPYPLEAVEPAAADDTAPRPHRDAHAVRRILLQYLRGRAGALSAQQVEYVVAFLSMAGEAEADGGAEAPAGVNAWHTEHP